MDAVTSIAAASGFFVVLVSACSLAYIIIRNGKDRSHLEGQFEEKVAGIGKHVASLAKNLDEFKDEVRKDVTAMRVDIVECKNVISDKHK